MHIIILLGSVHEWYHSLYKFCYAYCEIQIYEYDHMLTVRMLNVWAWPWISLVVLDLQSNFYALAPLGAGEKIKFVQQYIMACLVKNYFPR